MSTHVTSNTYTERNGTFAENAKHRASVSLVDILFSRNRMWLILTDSTVLALGFILCVWNSPNGRWGIWTPVTTVGCTTFVLSYLLAATGLGMYELFRRHHSTRVVFLAALSSFLALPAALTTTYFVKYAVFGRLTILYGAVGGFLAISSFRFLLAYLYRRLPYRFAIIGKSKLTEQILKGLDSKRAQEFKFVFNVPLESLLGKDGRLIPEKIRSSGVSDFLVCDSAWVSKESAEMALCALQSRHKIFEELDFFCKIYEQVPVDTVTVGWVLQQGLNPRNLLFTAVKRCFDIIASSVGLLCLSPILLLISFFIKATSPGPVIFLQPRQGRYQVPFMMYKFRTMNAADSRQDASGGFTGNNDKRVTFVGRLIRPLHLDELPQLLNILKGDMSLVGPRPEALDFAHKMAEALPLYGLRYLLRPGLTGHAQINVGYMMDNISDTKKKLSLDLYYLTNQSLSLDARLILRTVFVVLKRALIRR